MIDAGAEFRSARARHLRVRHIGNEGRIGQHSEIDGENIDAVGPKALDEKLVVRPFRIEGAGRDDGLHGGPPMPDAHR